MPPGRFDLTDYLVSDLPRRAHFHQRPVRVLAALPHHIPEVAHDVLDHDADAPAERQVGEQPPGIVKHGGCYPADSYAERIGTEQGNETCLEADAHDSAPWSVPSQRGHMSSALPALGQSANPHDRHTAGVPSH